eukprot:gene8871-13323_t
MGSKEVRRDATAPLRDATAALPCEVFNPFSAVNTLGNSEARRDATAHLRDATAAPPHATRSTATRPRPRATRPRRDVFYPPAPPPGSALQRQTARWRRRAERAKARVLATSRRAHLEPAPARARNATTASPLTLPVLALALLLTPIGHLASQRRRRKLRVFDATLGFPGEGPPKKAGGKRAAPKKPGGKEAPPKKPGGKSAPPKK